MSRYIKTTAAQKRSMLESAATITAQVAQADIEQYACAVYEVQAAVITAVLSNREINAEKRKCNKISSLSIFASCANAESQAFQIDNALSEYRTMKELTDMLNLSEARIRSHVNYLKKHYSNTCTFEIHSADESLHVARKRFRFVLK